MASSRVGLRGARDMVSISIPAATIRRTWGLRIASGRSQLPCIASSSVRWYAAPKLKVREWTPPSPKTQAAERSQTQMSAADVAFVLPGTLVAPPLSQYPRKPGEFLRFLREVFVVWVRTTASGLGVVWGSKPSMFKGAQFKLNNAAALLEAKALHRTMAEALAAGDKNTLSSICTKLMATPMMAAIDSRPRTRRFRWELVEYTGWRNPRIASQMVAPTVASGSGPLLRQLVVSISSKQRRTEEARVKDGSWQVVPDGVKEASVTENVVLVSIINPKTWKQGEWRILGTIPTMTPAEYFSEKKMLERLEQEQFRAKLESK